MKETITSFENYARKINVLAGIQSPENIKGEPGLGGGGKMDLNVDSKSSKDNFAGGYSGNKSKELNR
jgi:hypothetical protein